jgi:NAD(P)-dependent dehydrogenase (short-subunit alcohol dehydrogenase family)
MINPWRTGGQTMSQHWSRAVRNALTCQWNLVDAQYQAGLRVIETLLGTPVGRACPEEAGTAPPAAAGGRTSPEHLPEEKVAPAPRRKEGALQIANKVAVVTGAASGIGEATARELAQRGARAVILVDRSDRVFSLVGPINEAAGRPVAEAKAGDVTSDAFRVSVFDEVTARHGVVHICVPAAGVARDALAVKVDKTTGQPAVYPVSTFREVTEVNLIAPVYWALEMVARVAQDRWRRGLGRWDPAEGVQGTVIFIGSVSSQGNKGQISYAATKAGLEGAAATLMKEAIYHGVRCGVIHPGFTDTPMVRAMGEEYIAKNVLPYTQLRRLIRPEEIADAICFLISNSAVSGELWADAGWHPSA